ncbi:MAG: hypothetical protein PHQ32_05900 [Firmicutes bacterium]|nr:hypothetical protein [Bacillota bacterium]
MQQFSFKEKTPLQFHNVFKYYILLMIFKLELLLVFEAFIYSTPDFQVDYYVKIVLYSISIIAVLFLILTSFGLFRLNKISYYAFMGYIFAQALKQILTLELVFKSINTNYANYLSIIFNIFINGLILYYYSKRKHIFNGKVKELFSFDQGNKATYCRKCGAKISSKMDKNCSKCGASSIFEFDELSKRINS